LPPAGDLVDRKSGVRAVQFVLVDAGVARQLGHVEPFRFKHDQGAFKAGCGAGALCWGH